MKLFIIGNGFDLAHHLPTRFFDFRTFLSHAQPGFLEQFEAHYNLYPESSKSAQEKFLWEDFELKLSNIDETLALSEGTDINLGLEIEDIGVENTNYCYVENLLGNIDRLPKYLKTWVRSIRIRDCLPRTSKIGISPEDMFVTFNYTAVLENVYHLANEQVIHIHGSLRAYTTNPIVGHGNSQCIRRMQKEVSKLLYSFDEKKRGAYRAVLDYYKKTFKDVKKYYRLLTPLRNKNIEEIIVVGHSIADIDIPYFEEIDRLTGKSKNWTVYYHSIQKAESKRNGLIKAGISERRISMKEEQSFFDLIDDTAASEYAAHLAEFARKNKPKKKQCAPLL